MTTCPSSVVAVTSRQSGTVSAATASEWYRVAVNGEGTPAKTLSPWCTSWEVLPCISCCAWPTRAP